MPPWRCMSLHVCSENRDSLLLYVAIYSKNKMASTVAFSPQPRPQHSFLLAHWKRWQCWLLTLGHTAENTASCFTIPATCHESSNQGFPGKIPTLFSKRRSLTSEKAMSYIHKDISAKMQWSELNTVAKINVIWAKQKWGQLRASVQVKPVYLLTFIFATRLRRVGKRKVAGWLKWKYCSRWSELGTQDPGWTVHNHL